MRKMQANSSGTFCCQNPQPASSMTTISIVFSKRISRSLGYLSASWPLVAENSTKGKMNSAPITKPASDEGSHCSWIW